MSSLLPHFLQSLQQALQSSLPELDYAPVKFCHAWSVLMFTLASVEPVAAQQQALRSVTILSTCSLLCLHKVENPANVD